VLRLDWIVALSDDDARHAADRLRAQLAAAGWADVGAGPSPAQGEGPQVPAQAPRRTPGRPSGGPDAHAIVVVADQPLPRDLVDRLIAGDLPVLLVGAVLPAADPDGRLAGAAGLRVGQPSPAHDVRVRPGPHADGLPGAPHTHGDHAHQDRHEHLTARVAPATATHSDVQVLSTARLGLADHPVLTLRPATRTAALTLQVDPAELAGRTVLRLLIGGLARLLGAPAPDPVGIGLLGYGAIGAEHSRAIRAVDGLRLAAVCDSARDRLEVARAEAPGVATSTRAEDLLDSAEVDLLVVSTPPDTHADWALRAIAAGKHVVVEKPFALGPEQADEVLAAARAADRLVVVYQNRRYDPDHLAIRRAVRRGDLGELFHIEAFVGGYGHPCNLWHSDEAVSGGAFYDWGAHLLDQVLDLVACGAGADVAIEHVSAAEHKRRWHDVTNADHSRVTIRFADGAEAEFIHSDLAAALKPRWYILGTRGAIVGHWRTERVVSRSAIGTLAEDVLAPADSPPLIDLHAADGSVTRLATPPAPAHAFHQELADRLRWGIPMTVTAEQSRRVLSVMAAARESAAAHGRPVVPR
jgi:predicted dehydrogenase